MAEVDVGILLRRHRRAAGLSIEALAEASGVSVRAIGDLERGRARAPQARTAAALADGLQLAAGPRADLLSAARDGRLRRTPQQPGLGDPPPDVPDFVGRGAELASLSRLADRASRPGLVVLSGAGGLGKSALAVHAAHRVAPGYPGGVVYVELRGLGRAPVQPVDALGRLVQALGVRQVPGSLDERVAVYRRALAEREVLVVLDDARDEAQVRPLLAGDGGSTVIVTSRRLLSGLEHATRLPLAPLSDDEAVALLAGAGGATDDVDALASVARACGNHPLALRIAGNRLLSRPSWTPADLAARLGVRGRRLDQLVAGDLQATAALALSHDQLEDGTRRVFRRLSLVPGRSASAEIAAVLTGLDVREAEHQLDELVELSLVQAVAGGRVAFHDLVADYAADRLAAEETEQERTTAATTLRSWLLSTAANAGRLFEPHPEAPPSSGGLRFDGLDQAERWLDTEADNWTAALADAAAAGQDRTVVDVAESMHWFSDRRLEWRSWIDVFDRSATAAGRMGDDRLQAAHLNYLSWALTRHARFEEAARAAGRAGVLARSAGDVRQEAWAHRYAADARSLADDPGGHVRALADLRRAGELFDRVGDAEGWLTSVVGAGHVLGRLGRFAEGLELLDQASHRLEDPASPVPRHILDWMRASLLPIQADLFHRSGDLEAAEATLRAMLADAGEDPALVVARARSWTLLGAVLADRGRRGEAREALLEARALFVVGRRDPGVAEVDAALAALDASSSRPATPAG